jgi:hypothetical protein
VWLGGWAALWLLSACASEIGGPADELGFDDGGGDDEVAVTSQPLTGNATYNGVYHVRAANICLGGTNDNNPCTSNAQCSGGTCWIGSKRCVGGPTPNAFCSNHSNCGIGGTCYDQGLKLWNSATTTTSFSIRMAHNTAVKMVGTAAPTPPSTAVPPTSGRYRVEHGSETGAPRWGWVDGGALVVHHVPNAGLSAVRTDALMRARSAMGFSYWWGHGKWLKSGPAITCDAAGQNCVPNAGRCDWNVGAANGCPQCTHTATGGTEYGADCSGFVSTIWGLSSGAAGNNSNPESDRVGYATSTFMMANVNWTTVSTCATPLSKCSGGSNVGMLCTSNANCPGSVCAQCPACGCFGSVLAADAVVKTGHMYLTGTARNASDRFQSYECIDCNTGCTPSVRTLANGSDSWKAIRKTAAGW